MEEILSEICNAQKQSFKNFVEFNKESEILKTSNSLKQSLLQTFLKGFLQEIRIFKARHFL